MQDARLDCLRAEGCKIGLPASYPSFAACEGPLAESMRMIATQEGALLVQASRCRVALTRLDMLQKIMASRECIAKEQMEVDRWKASSVTMQTQLNKYLGTAGRDLAELLGEKSMTNAGKWASCARFAGFCVRAPGWFYSMGRGPRPLHALSLILL